MIGMDFHEFLVLLILSSIASMVAPYLLRTVTSKVSMASCRSGWRPGSELGLDNPYWAIGGFEFGGLGDSGTSRSIRRCIRCRSDLEGAGKDHAR